MSTCFGYVSTMTLVAVRISEADETARRAMT